MNGKSLLSFITECSKLCPKKTEPFVLCYCTSTTDWKRLNNTLSTNSAMKNEANDLEQEKRKEQAKAFLECKSQEDFEDELEYLKNMWTKYDLFSESEINEMTSECRANYELYQKN